MEIKNLDMKYVKEATSLAIMAYEEECSNCQSLIKRNFEEELEGLIAELFRNNHGKVAFKEDQMIGYIAFEGPWDGFFGRVKGAFSPLGGSAFSGEDRGKLASKLLEAATADMAQEGITSFAISYYAHDREVGEALVMNGFGIRCSDAIMKLSERSITKNVPLGITYDELGQEEKTKIRSLQKGLILHLLGAPIFFPTDIKRAEGWFANKSIRVFVAKEKEKIIGYMALDTEAETFVTEAPDIYNICGAYVDEAYRGSGIAEGLLEHMCKVAERENMKYLGVDCETLNPNARYFWGKYFNSYTYSYHRRIDERVIGYNSYLIKEWK